MKQHESCSRCKALVWKDFKMGAARCRLGHKIRVSVKADGGPWMKLYEAHPKTPCEKPQTKGRMEVLIRQKIEWFAKVVVLFLVLTGSAVAHPHTIAAALPISGISGLIMLACVLILMTIWALFDFFLQADQHEWYKYRIFENGAWKAPRWPWWGEWRHETVIVSEGLFHDYTWKLRDEPKDKKKKWPWYLAWIPRDEWHRVQTVKNLAVISTIGVTLYPLIGWWCVAVLPAYWITRGIGFTIPMSLAPNVTKK